MKKIVKLVSLVLVAVMCVAVFASCAPASDPEKAKAALEKKEYSVMLTTSETVAGKATLAGAGFFLADGAELEAWLVGTSKDLKNAVTIFYFTDAKGAKDSFKAYEDSVSKEDKENEDFVFAQSGKMIYAGSKEAVKAAR
ncbi:MAG: hypothetical protein ACI3XE_00345 [Eubacteriales bacterium]